MQKINIKNTFKRNSIFSEFTKSNNILPILTKKNNEKLEPQEFYYPIKYELKNNNYGSVGFRSKTQRFKNIKPTPHEFDIEPYKFLSNNSEHRVSHRPWLQQIQATLNDVFINDHTYDRFINTSEILISLKSDRQINNSSNIDDVENTLSNPEDSSTESNNKKSKNPYSECFFIKEPYKIETVDDQPKLTEEEQKFRKYMELLEKDELSTKYITRDLESPENFHEPNTSKTINDNSNDNSDNNTNRINTDNSIDNNNSIENNESNPTENLENNVEDSQDVSNEPSNNNVS